MKINPEELHFEQWPTNPINGIPGKTYASMKVTHLPTGMTCTSCKYQDEAKNRKDCIRQIEQRVEVLA